jgi:hypothetical protein
MIMEQGVVRPGPFGALCRGMSRRDRQAHHIGERSCVMISDLPDQPGDLAGEHRLAGNDLVERSQDSFMISGGYPFQDEPVPEPAGKTVPGPWNPAPRRHPVRPSPHNRRADRGD